MVKKPALYSLIAWIKLVAANAHFGWHQGCNVFVKWGLP